MQGSSQNTDPIVNSAEDTQNSPTPVPRRKIPWPIIILVVGIPSVILFYYFVYTPLFLIFGVAYNIGVAASPGESAQKCEINANLYGARYFVSVFTVGSMSDVARASEAPFEIQETFQFELPPQSNTDPCVYNRDPEIAIDYGDGSPEVTYSGSQAEALANSLYTFDHTYTKPGTYQPSVSISAIRSLDGQRGTASSSPGRITVLDTLVPTVVQDFYSSHQGTDVVLEYCNTRSPSTGDYRYEVLFRNTGTTTVSYTEQLFDPTGNELPLSPVYDCSMIARQNPSNPSTEVVPFWESSQN